MAIRYDKKLENEITKTVRNFNAKISRLEKNERELLPDKVSKQAIKQINDRADLKRKLQELQRFGKRGAEDIITTKGGVRITQYALNNLKQQTKRVKQNITREITRLKTEKPKVFGKEQDITFAQMGDDYYLTTLKRKEKLNKSFLELSQEEFENYENLVNRLSQNEAYMNYVFKENYLKMLTDLGYYYKYSKKKMKVIKDKLMALDKSDFLELFRSDKAISAVLNYYPVVTGQINLKNKRGKNDVGINPKDIMEDVYNLYDNLYDNLDEILSDYA